LCSSPYTFLGGYQIKEEETDGACDTYGVGGLVVRKPAEKGSHGRSWHRWADNTELNLKRRRMGGRGPD
jgi:hypothetical protein